MTTRSTPLEMDVQIHPGFTILNIEPVPGVNKLTLRMWDNELNELNDLTTEARLNRRGHTEAMIFAKDVETGDILPGFGPISEAVRAHSKIYLMFNNGAEASFPEDFHLTVHRRIS